MNFIRRYSLSAALACGRFRLSRGVTAGGSDLQGRSACPSTFRSSPQSTRRVHLGVVALYSPHLLFASLDANATTPPPVRTPDPPPL